MSIPSSSILKAFVSAPSPDAWLSSELKASLAEDMPDNEANDFIAKTRSDAREQADDFLDSEVAPDQVVTVIVVFARPGEDESAASGGIFTRAPSPLALLELAANECQPLDEVVISHRFASGEEITLTQTWPFGLSGAVDLLTPGSAPLPEEVLLPSQGL